MAEKHSINESYFHRILGSKHRKHPNSFLKVALAESPGINVRFLVITVGKAGGPTLRMTLLGQEAQELGMTLVTLGAKASALQEADYLKK